MAVSVPKNPIPSTVPPKRPRDLNDVTKRYARFTNSWTAITILILSATLLRLIYLAWFSPYALVEDEAHYWEWSRHLDWSYYSKGPGVALLISASTFIFGDTAFAVRLPAVLASAILTFAIAALAADVTNDRRAGFFAAACTLLAPIYQLAAILMTIDGPYVACWAFACWAAWRALARGSNRAWLALGLALAIGILFKYTILLLPPGIILFALISRRNLNLSQHWKRSALAAVAIALLGTLPIIIWNAQHEWVTFKHLLGHVAMPGGDVAPSNEGLIRWNPLWTLELIASQIAMLGGILFLGIYTVIEAFRRRKAEAQDWTPKLFLICLSLPILAFYLAVTLFSQAEANWPMAGFVTLIALCGWGVVDALDRNKHLRKQWRALPADSRPRWGIYRKKPQLHRQKAWHVSLVVGIIVAAVLFRLDMAAPVIDSIATFASRVGARVGIGYGADLNVVPVGRMISATHVAQSVETQLATLDEKTEQEPFLIAQHYGRASQLAFYLPDHPTVYCSSSLMSGRQTQYDLWEQTNLHAPDLLGRPAILLGGQQYQWDRVFDRVEPIGPIEGDHKQDRQAFFGFGYRGFETEN